MAGALCEGPRMQSSGTCTRKGAAWEVKGGSDKRTQGTKAENGLTHTPKTFPYLTRLHPTLLLLLGVTQKLWL